MIKFQIFLIFIRSSDKMSIGLQKIFKQDVEQPMSSLEAIAYIEDEDVLNENEFAAK